MGLVNVDHNVSHDDDNIDDDDPETIIHVRLMVWCNIYKQQKACKKRKNDKQRIHFSSMASNKMVGLIYIRRFFIDHFLLMESRIKLVKGGR